MRDPTELVMTIVYKVMDYKKVLSLGWSLRDGVKFFINPDVQCPNCEQWVPTNRNWLVDDKYRVLLGCWDRQGNPIDGLKVIVHPHVYYTNEICMGKCGTSSEALFTGVASGTHYQNTETWFWMLGHSCPNVAETFCNDCNRSHPGNRVAIYIAEDDSRLNLCKGIKEYRCASCEKYFEEFEGGNLSDGDDSYCPDCQKINDPPVYYCSCDFGGGHSCDNEVSREGGRCDSCYDNCNEPEVWYCNCDVCGGSCSNEVAEDGDMCGDCCHDDNDD